MQASDFEFYRKLLIEECGIAIDADRMYLLETRLATISQSLGFQSNEELTLDLRMHRNPTLIRSVVEAMTTNETFFFRDVKPFTVLKDVILPEIQERNKNTKNLKIWNAACSSGQEPYSIAMTIDTIRNFDDWNVRIIGTDLSEKMITQAQSGTYNQFEIQRGLSIQQMLKYFKQVNSQWQISDSMRAKVRFEVGNILEPAPLLIGFDIIFCRNMLIYFETETRVKVLNQLIKRLNPGGFIVLGVSETITDLRVPLKTYEGNHSFFVVKH
ncbi:MAG: protein-glutamate O-methyltransferase CheR [Alphaproteobacteria bacterium]